MIKVRVGGVPEHFNLAWHQAIENGAFAKSGYQIEWTDVPGGTGAMCQSLRNNELDIAIALTEGVVKDIANGNPSKIVQFYVNSPLRWGIFVHATSPIGSIPEMQGKKYAISRFQSGSHLMAFVNARKHGLTINQDDFVLVGDLDGARKALQHDEAQLFMWEKFTTKPLVDAGEFKMIGECSSPWPCFVVAMTDAFLSTYADHIEPILNILNLQCWLLQNDAHAPALISKRYGIQQTDAALWFKELEYACKPEIEEEQMQTIFNDLKQLAIINRIPAFSEICHTAQVSLI